MAGKIEVLDTWERVTGELHYVDDIRHPGDLYGKLVRSTKARARIVGISIDKAIKSDGVEGVYSYLDFPQGVPKFGPMTMDQPILADKEVRYYGEPVVLIIADSQDNADLAAESVVIDYEEMIPVVDVRKALDPKASLVARQDNLHDYDLKGSNINCTFINRWGNCEKAEKKSDLIVKNEYYMPPIHHNAMENYSCIAKPEHGGVAVIASIQSPFQARIIIADMLNLPHSKVQIRGREIGGGFGGRGYPKIEPITAYFAYRLKKTIKIKLSSHECFLSGQRESAQIIISTGFNNLGKILFQNVDAGFGIGAYTDISPRVVNKAGMLGTGAYKTNNAELNFKGIYTNTTPATGYRGFGASHVSFAIDSQMDEAARKLNIDPVKIRMMNLPDKGDDFIPTEKPADGNWKESLLKGAELIDFYNKPAKGRARSIAVGIKNSIAATTMFARVRINSDGSACAYLGTSEMGQGSREVMRKYVNRFLGIPLEKIDVINADTEKVPFDFVTASSRSTTSMGIAIKDACNKLKEGLFRLVEKNFGTSPVKMGKGNIQTSDGKLYTLEEILKTEYGNNMGEIEATGVFKAKKDPANPLGGPCTFYEFVVTVLELEVDKETGEITIHKLINVTDAGKLINPLRAAGVDEGGAVMGIGAATMEQLLYDNNGYLQNSSSLDYRIPTTMDIPEEIESYFIENGDGPGPGGEKGIGEGGILAVPSAVREGIYKCIGHNIKELPYTSEVIWQHIKMLP